MDFITIFIIAVGLSMDAFAVSIAVGATDKRPGVRHAFRTALAFGGFQAIMPVIGWLLGLAVKGWVEGYDHWVAFGLLGTIGGKMIYESCKIKQTSRHCQPIGTTALMTLAVATSIDALAVGITLSFLMADSVTTAVIIIGAVTFTLSYAGVYIGKNLGHFFETGFEALAGLVLLGIGTKILLEHLLT
jgi:putative Mn2+ efflux pump MntP